MAHALNGRIAGAAGPEQNILHTLIQEAQGEIGRLRAELYSTSRLAEERRQALDAITAARDQLAAVAHQLEDKVQVMHSQVMQLPQLQQQVANLQEQQQQLDKDRAVQQQARRILESELQDERTARSAAEEARAQAEADRARLQLTRDDLAAQLRVLKQRVSYAEEEQMRAEEEAQQLRQELAAAAAGGQLASSVAAVGEAGDAGGASLRAELHAAGMRIASLEQALHSMQAAAMGAKAQGEQLQLQLQATTRQLHDAQVHQADLLCQTQQSQLQGRDDPQAAAVAAAARADQLATDLAEAQYQVRLLTQALSAAEVQLAASRAEAAAAARASGAHTSKSVDKEGPGGTACAGSSSGDAAVAAAVDVAAEAEALQEQIELLMDKVVSLKKSRDKLLEQLDGQSLELEQLLAEHQVLLQRTMWTQEEGKNWQAQAQDALITISRLQDMLSGEWHTCQLPAGPATGAAADASRQEQRHKVAPGAAVDAAAPRASLVSQQATPELQVRVLAAQLLRSQAACKGISSSLVQLLSGVEARLLALKCRALH